MRLAVIGTGYVGLVAGSGFADFGNDVACVDLDAARVERLARGDVPIHEPGLAELVRRNLDAGRLRFTTHLPEAVRGADVVILAVGTPQRADAPEPDLGFIDEAARQIGRALDGAAGFRVIVTKSTVPVGTAERIRALIAAETRCDFAVAANPEFLKEGDAVADFMKPARVIVGVDAGDERAIERLRALYAPFVRTGDRVLMMDLRSAELTKYAANAMLAVRVSFMNELALLAERVGADIERVRVGIGADPRIGPKFLFAGAGFGGSCFPKDLRALGASARPHGLELGVVDAAERANVRQRRVLGERIVEHLGAPGGSLAGRRVALWGLAFKPETDDLREAPALVLIDQLLAAGAEVVAYDPAAMEATRALYGERIALAPNMYAAVEGADALALVTEWKQFRGADLARVRAAMRTPAIFDGRNIWSPAEVVALGFHHAGVGRGAGGPRKLGA